MHLSHDPCCCRDVVIKVYNSEKDADADRARVNRKIFFNEAHMFVCCGIRASYRFTMLVKIEGAYYVVTEHVQGARTLSAYCHPDNLLPVVAVIEFIYKCAKARLMIVFTLSSLGPFSCSPPAAMLAGAQTVSDSAKPATFAVRGVRLRSRPTARSRFCVLVRY